MLILLCTPTVSTKMSQLFPLNEFYLVYEPSLLTYKRFHLPIKSILIPFKRWPSSILSHSSPEYAYFVSTVTV